MNIVPGPSGPELDLENRMKILLTGVAGFIGYNLARALLEKNIPFVGIDDLNDHYDPELKKRRLDDLRGRSPEFRFAKIDVRDLGSMDRLFKRHRFTHIVNFAARAGVRNSLVNPWIYFQTNTIAVINILELMKKYGIRRLIQASTSSVYGNNKVPFKERDEVVRPLSPYASSKISTETLCHSYHYIYGFDITVFRFFTVYGDMGRPDLSIFRFIRWIEQGKSVQIYGDGFQRRDFTHVSDVAAAVVKALGLKGFHVMNLGNNRPVELMRVIRLIERYLGKKAKLKFSPASPADIYRTCASISEARKLLGWTPRVSIEEGLKKTVDWYVKNADWAGRIKLG